LYRTIIFLCYIFLGLESIVVIIVGDSGPRTALPGSLGSHRLERVFIFVIGRFGVADRLLGLNSWG